MNKTLRILAAFALLTAFSFAKAEDGAATADAAGTWNLQVVTDQGNGTPSFTFAQDGENLTGRYKGMFGEAPVNGTVMGDAITFSIKVDAQGQEITITYSGTLSGDTMKGTVKFGDMGGATFTGKRAPK